MLEGPAQLLASSYYSVCVVSKAPEASAYGSKYVLWA